MLPVSLLAAMLGPLSPLGLHDMMGDSCTHGARLSLESGMPPGLTAAQTQYWAWSGHWKTRSEWE